MSRLEKSLSFRYSETRRLVSLIFYHVFLLCRFVFQNAIQHLHFNTSKENCMQLFLGFVQITWRVGANFKHRRTPTYSIQRNVTPKKHQLRSTRDKSLNTIRSNFTELQRVYIKSALHIFQRQATQRGRRIFCFCYAVLCSVSRFKKYVLLVNQIRKQHFVAEAPYAKQNAGLLLVHVAMCCVRHEIVQIMSMQVPEKVVGLLGGA